MAMQGAQTEQPITTLIGFLKENFGDKFKAYYDGDPDEIPKDNLPCIICVKNSDDMQNDGTSMKKVTEELQVKIVFNKADDWSPEENSNPDDTRLTEKKIRDIVEARSVDGGYDPSTIKYALMNRFQVNGIAFSQSMRFELGVLPRSADLITEEGHLTITLSYLMPNVNS